jgi:transposase
VSAPLQPIVSPHSDPLSVEVITQLQRELAYAQLKIQLLEERLRQMRIAKYGKASEKLSDLQLELLEVEPGVSREEVIAESERESLAASSPAIESESASTQQRDKKKHPGRQTLPAHLVRVEKIIACTPDQCICGGCGKETTVIGYEESEVLDVKPAEYFVRVTKREKRVCKRCEELGVVTAPVLESIIAKSLVSDQIIIDTVVAKYCNSLPLYRQSAILKRDTGLDISRATMDGWVMQVGELLTPMVRRMRNELLTGNYIQADETPVGVQMHDRSGKNHQAYLWQYGSPGKNGVPADRSSSVGCGSVVFDFRMGREREGPKQFLGQFNGILQTDGYAAYEGGIGGPTMVHACCLAHARRKYIDAIKVDPKDKDSASIVALMDELFAIDAEARAKKMNHAERHALRMERAPALVTELRTQILAAQCKVLPQSAAGKAARYTLALWNKLTIFLEYPELELSNNLAENSMRPIAIGRKNWVHLGSKQAGPKVAAIFSIVESCRRLGLPIREYLAAVLPGLASRSVKSLDQLTPAAYAASKAK